MKQTIRTYLAVGTAILGACALAACSSGNAVQDADVEVASGDYERGPNRGRLLRSGDLEIEVTIFEAGVDPQFRLYAYQNGLPIDPSNVDVSLELGRLGGVTDVFAFTPENDYLVGDGVVVEPHSFDVRVQARAGGMSGQWSYESYEGRTTIAQDQADAAGVAVETAGPGVIEEVVSVFGRLEFEPSAEAEIAAWLPGRISSLDARLGDRVEAGQRLARVTARDSLQTYSVTTPIDGMVVAQNATLNSPTGGEPMYVVADPEQLHAELFVYPSDLQKIEIGQPVMLTSTDGQRTYTSAVEFLLPSVDDMNQRSIVHIETPNPDETWRAGEAVTADIVVGRETVPLAVRTRALQRFRDFTVVYARVGETYEVRMLEIGRQTPEWTEVLGGLEPGTEYVTDNAFLIRADIEKSGASHDH